MQLGHLAAEIVGIIEHNFATSRQSCIPVPLVTAVYIGNYQDLVTAAQ
jgi:hypothetical protein